MDSNELKALIFLNLLGERKRVMECLEQGMAPGEVLERVRQGIDPETEGNEWLQRFDPEKEIERCEGLGIRLLTWFDADYPRLLKEIYDPPLVLYVKGGFDPSDEAALAIVGTRHPSIYGTDQARRFARSLAEAGLTIVSGFAKGIDQAAHNAALEIRHGRTIAVLGCGLNIPYPRGSEKLFERLAGQGAVISECPLDAEPRPENFPKRNRIIAGLSLGTLVIEAAARSGSLITAHEAAEQGKEVFALPGPVDRLSSTGSNHLIKEGAHLAESPQDILEILAFRLKWFHAGPAVAQVSAQITGETRTPLSEVDSSLRELLSFGPLSLMEMIGASSLSPPQLLPLLTQWELEGRLRKGPDGRFRLSR